MESRRAIAHDADALGEIEGLLAKYPDVTDAERDRIGRFLRGGAPIDIGLLSSSSRSWQAAERFKAENPAYFALGLRVYAAWILALVAIALCLFLIKDLGAH